MLRSTVVLLRLASPRVAVATLTAVAVLVRGSLVDDWALMVAEAMGLDMDALLGLLNNTHLVVVSLRSRVSAAVATVGHWSSDLWLRVSAVAAADSVTDGLGAISAWLMVITTRLVAIAATRNVSVTARLVAVST